MISCRPNLRLLLAISVLVPLMHEAYARTIMVDQRGGEGVQVSLQSAVDAAKPGDVISTVPGSGPYREGIRIKQSGEPEKPITLEGNGEVIDLGVDISQGPWSQEKGLWVLESPRIPPKTWGMNQRATAFYKGKPITFHDKADLPQPDYSVSLDEEGRLHFRFPEEMAPPFSGLMLPVKPTLSAVALVNASYWHIRGLHVLYAGNDGFNYHGEGKGIETTNCSALFCGDEGSSAHYKMEVTTRDSLFAFNGSGTGGVADVHESVTSYSNCISAYNRSYGYTLKNASGTLTNSLSAANGRPENNKVLPPTTTTLDNFEDWPAEPGILERIQAWHPDHPQLPYLLETVRALQAEGADFTY